MNLTSYGEFRWLILRPAIEDACSVGALRRDRVQASSTPASWLFEDCILSSGLMWWELDEPVKYETAWLWQDALDGPDLLPHMLGLGEAAQRHGWKNRGIRPGRRE